MTALNTSQALAEAERVSALLIGEIRALLRWEWDSRFGAVLSVVKAPNDQQVLELLARLFANAWDHQTIAGAPDGVRQIASALGLHAGQRLYTLDPVNDPLLFAAWWPWAGGKAASLRVGCSAQGSENDPVAELRRWFSL